MCAERLPGESKKNSFAGLAASPLSRRAGPVNLAAAKSVTEGPPIFSPSWTGLSTGNPRL